MKDYKNLKYIRQFAFANLNTVVTEYNHVKTGAAVLRVSNKSQERLFGISFHTIPQDSTGVAHILEHSVLFGSEKYPSNDPFLTLIKTSMATYINAVTYPDKTIYPVGSSNIQDLFNLTDVYLDCVFSPLLGEYTVYNEGRRLEITKDETTGVEKLSFQGVVYNEMKGVYSDIGSTIYDTLLLPAVYPENEYRHDSGGNPAVVQELVYEDLVKFYNDHYHPTNSLSVIYGDMTEDEENILFDKLLSYFDKFAIGEVKKLSNELKPWSKPKYQELKYNSQSADDKTVYLNIAYRVNGCENNYISAHKTIPAWGTIMNYILEDDRPAYNEIMEIEGVKRIYFYTDKDLVLPFFNFSFEIDLDIVNKDKEGVIGKIKNVLDTHLKLLVDKGFEGEYAQGLISQTEFSIFDSLEGGDKSKFFSFFNSFSIGIDYAQTLNFEANWEHCKAILQDKVSLKKLIDELYFENNTNITQLYFPDTEMSEKQSKLDDLKLAKKLLTLTDNDKENILEVQNRILSKEEQDVSALPKLQLKDINNRLDIAVAEHEKKTDKTLVYYLDDELKTSNISLYFDLDRSNISADNYSYLEIIVHNLLIWGSENYDSDKLKNTIKKYIGRASTDLDYDIEDDMTFSLHFSLMPNNCYMVNEIVSELFSKRDFNNKKLIISSLKEALSSLESVNKNESATIALEKLRMQIIDTQFYVTGATEVQIVKYKQMIAEVENDFGGFVRKLEEVFSKFLVGANFSLAYRGSKLSYTEGVKSIANIITSKFSTKPYEYAVKTLKFKDETAIKKLNGKPLIHQTKDIVNSHHQYLIVKNKCEIFGYNKVRALNLLICTIARLEYIWKEVRAKGGAYGGGIKYDMPANYFYCSTWRDPRVVENYNLGIETMEFMSKLKMGVSEFDSYKLSAMNGLYPYKNTKQIASMAISNYYKSFVIAKDVEEIYYEMSQVTLEELKQVAKFNCENNMFAGAVAKGV